MFSKKAQIGYTIHTPIVIILTFIILVFFAFYFFAWGGAHSDGSILEIEDFPDSITRDVLRTEYKEGITFGDQLRFSIDKMKKECDMNTNGFSACAAQLQDSNLEEFDKALSQKITQVLGKETPWEFHARGMNDIEGDWLIASYKDTNNMKQKAFSLASFPLLDGNVVTLMFYYDFGVAVEEAR